MYLIPSLNQYSTPPIDHGSIPDLYTHMWDHCRGCLILGGLDYRCGPSIFALNSPMFVLGNMMITHQPNRALPNNYIQPNNMAIHIPKFNLYIHIYIYTQLLYQCMHMLWACMSPNVTHLYHLLYDLYAIALLNYIKAFGRWTCYRPTILPLCPKMLSLLTSAACFTRSSTPAADVQMPNKGWPRRLVALGSEPRAPYPLVI